MNIDHVTADDITDSEPIQPEDADEYDAHESIGDAKRWCMYVVAAAVALLLLVACGGGGDADAYPTETVGPINCQECTQ